MRHETGMTLIEMLLTVSALGLVLLAGASYALPWLARESARGAAYDVQTYMQLARIEAVSRNHICRMELDTDDGALEVIDGNGTTITTDDIVLYQRRLPDNISFARPDSGSAVTLDGIDSTTFQVEFGSDGVVSLGAGEVCLLGGERYQRVQIFWAGGIQVNHWDGSQWKVGS